MSLLICACHFDKDGNKTPLTVIKPSRQSEQQLKAEMDERRKVIIYMAIRNMFALLRFGLLTVYLLQKVFFSLFLLIIIILYLGLTLLTNPSHALTVNTGHLL